jgi:simple sugar transport system ATP-binding protein
VGRDTSSRPAVELLGITKRFGSVVACDDVDLVLERGRIHGVLGENGAGKSTLMKVLIGLIVPDAGTVKLNGETQHIRDPRHSAELGIAMVHQHFSLVEAMTVWENVALGDVGMLDPRRVRARVREISEQYGLDIDPDARIHDLSAGFRQRVEIIKCLRRDPEVLIFDEPTSVLSPSESDFLFEALRRVVEEEGKAVALVSHKLPEILTATDDITIMRDGRVVAQHITATATASSLAQAMVGSVVALRGESAAALGVVDTEVVVDSPVVDVEAPISVKRQPALQVRGATVHSRDGVLLLDGLDLEVYPGEVVGVAGVEGNGQRTLGDVLSSLVTLEAGSVHVAGALVPTGIAGAMSRARVAVIPEDRHDSGCVLDLSVAENLVLAHPWSVARRGFIDRRRLRKEAAALMASFGVCAASPDAPMWSLSGGNQQRVILARELSNDPLVLVAAQPTRGLAVGAIEYMSGRLREAAERGLAVLLISTELEEIIDLSDRILVISKGRIVGEMTRSTLDLERLGLLMGGAGFDIRDDEDIA